MTGLTKGEGAAISVSHWKSLGNTSWDHVPFRMAALCTRLPRGGFIGGHSFSTTWQSCSSPLRFEFCCCLTLSGEEENLAQHSLRWPSPRDLQRHAQSRRSHWEVTQQITAPEADRGHLGPLAQGHLAPWAGSPSSESATGPRSRTSQLRLEIGLPWNVFSHFWLCF